MWGTYFLILPVVSSSTDQICNHKEKAHNIPSTHSSSKVNKMYLQKLKTLRHFLFLVFTLFFVCFVFVFLFVCLFVCFFYSSPASMQGPSWGKKKVTRRDYKNWSTWSSVFSPLAIDLKYQATMFHHIKNPFLDYQHHSSMDVLKNNIFFCCL